MLIAPDSLECGMELAVRELIAPMAWDRNRRAIVCSVHGLGENRSERR
jgi:hypothetical protein